MASFALPVAQTLAVEVVDQVMTLSSILTGSRFALVHVCREENKHSGVTRRDEQKEEEHKEEKGEEEEEDEDGLLF